MDERSIIKDIEMYLFAQFIDVLEKIEEFDKIEDLKNNIKQRKKDYKENIEKMLVNEDVFDIDQIDSTIDEKIEKYSKIYCKTERYKKIDEEIEKKKEQIKNIEKVEEIEDLIYEKCNFDFKCAYKLGLIDGIKIVTLKSS